MPREETAVAKKRRAQANSKVLSALGRIGAKARNEKLTPEERRAIAIKASRAAAKARKAKAKEATNGS